MRAYVLSDLRQRCQQRADMENNALIATDEWGRLISEMYGELYSLVEKSGMRYFETEATVTATGAASYALPSDHLATIDVSRVTDTAGHRIPLRRLMVQERNRWIGALGDARKYELAGQNLVLYPLPSTGTYKHLYMPQSPDLSTAIDSTSIDVVQADGEAYLIWGVAAKALSKPESEALAYADVQRDKARDRFVEWCAMRAFNDGSRVVTDWGTEDDYGDENGAWNPASFRWNPP